MDHTKLDQAELDSPCGELSNGGLGIVVALTFVLGIMFSCVYWGSIPAVLEWAQGTTAGSFLSSRTGESDAGKPDMAHLMSMTFDM